MRFANSTKCFYPKNENYSQLPADIVDVTMAEYVSAMNRGPDEVIDFIDGHVVVVPKQAPTLNELKVSKSMAIESERNAAIEQPVTSSALGSPHIYSAKPENRNFLNNLITLGNGGKFTCMDADGIKARRLHTHAQLMALAYDIEAHISAQFDHYEDKLAAIDAANTLAELDSVVW